MILFCISVDGELFRIRNFSNTLTSILACNLSSQVLQHGKEYDIFCVLDNLNIALLRQRTRNDFIQALMARDIMIL